MPERQFREGAPLGYRSLDSVGPCRDHHVVKNANVSATILADVEPLCLMPSGPPPEKFEEIMRIAALIWNSVVMDDHRGTDYLSQARSQLRLFDDPCGRQFMLALVDHLVDRKRSEFA